MQDFAQSHANPFPSDFLPGKLESLKSALVGDLVLVSPSLARARIGPMEKIQCGQAAQAWRNLAAPFEGSPSTAFNDVSVMEQVSS